MVFYAYRIFTYYVLFGQALKSFGIHVYTKNPSVSMLTYSAGLEGLTAHDFGETFLLFKNLRTV